MRLIASGLAALCGCVHASPAEDPGWLLAGSGARTHAGRRSLDAVAFVRLPSDTAVDPATLEDRIHYVTRKQARRLVVRMRQAARQQPDASVRLLGPAEAADALERLQLQLMGRVTEVGRFRGDDGVYVGLAIDVDAFIADIARERPAVARWMAEGFKTLESEDSTEFLLRR